MSEPITPDAADEDTDSLALEYALGVLDEAERRAAARRSADDPAFATQVFDWQALLAPMAAAVPPVAPAPSLWPRIDAAVAADEARHRSIVLRPARRLWHSLAFWRGFAFGSMALAAASLAAFAVVAPRAPAKGTAMAATVLGGPAGIVAAFNPQARKLLIVPAAPSASQQWVPELWLIMPGSTPLSLGVVDPGQPTEVKLSPDLAGQLNQSPTLAISLEPVGGSPSGAPTGPVIARGTLHHL
jgi:anti-sigma-K factor RskA